MVWSWPTREEDQGKDVPAWAEERTRELLAAAVEGKANYVAFSLTKQKVVLEIGFPFDRAAEALVRARRKGK